MALILYLILLILLIIIYNSSNEEPTVALQTQQQPFKLLGIQHMKLGINDPPEIQSFRMFSAPIVFPRSKNLWTDEIVKNILVDNQGQFGSCTAHALSYCWQQAILRSNEVFFRPSRTFWYAESRKKLGDRNYKADNGSTISDTAWVLSNMGSVQESLYPYTSTNINNAVPEGSVKTIALQRRRQTRRITYSNNVNTNIINFKTEILAGRCIMLGVMVYSSFMSSKTLKSGIIPLPNARRERLLGGHAIALSGWNETTRTFSFRNSWGEGVGQRGLFTIPYSYVCNGSLAGDAWVVA
jgi:C1A family cysteine protease